MTVIALTCGILTLAFAWWIFTARSEAPALSDRELKRQALEERKAAVYENLKDLHFEHLAGKLSEADFARTRQMLESEAAGVIAALEQLQ